MKTSIEYCQKAYGLLHQKDPLSFPINNPFNTQESVIELEKKLGVELPVSYKWFLETIGFLTYTEKCNLPDFPGIAENELDDFLNVLSIAKYNQSIGIPLFLVQIFKTDETRYMLDLSKMNNKYECPVVFF